VLIFFANWQSQACRLLVEATRSAALQQEVADYVDRMHVWIIDGGFYDEVKRHPNRPVSVAVACALEGLNDACALARGSSVERVQRYRRCICTGLEYLLRLKCTDGERTGRIRLVPGRAGAENRHHRSCGQRLHEERRERDRARAVSLLTPYCLVAATAIGG
jgi:hypothetical protein